MALHGGGDIDIVSAIAKIGDKLELGAGSSNQFGIDAVGDRRHQNPGPLHGGNERIAGEGFVGLVPDQIKQLAHPRLDSLRQTAGQDDKRFLRFMSAPVRLGCFRRFAVAPVLI